MAKYCWNCGKELRDEAVFCKYCGSEISPKSSRQEEPLHSMEESNDIEPKYEEYPAEEFEEYPAEELEEYPAEEFEEYPEEEYEEPIAVDEEELEQKNKDKKLFGIVGIVLGVIVLAVIIGAIFYYNGMGKSKDSSEPKDATEATAATEETTAPVDENIADQLEVVLWDINFSQVEDLGDKPVGVLLKIRNDSTAPVKSVEYSIKASGKKFKNREDGGNLFNAFGYIKPGETGYLYGQIKVPSDTPREQGEITIKKATKGKDLGDYQMPYGQIVNFNEGPDTYDVSIKNPNSSSVKPNSSIVIVVIDDKNTLNDAWGYGTVKDTIGENEEMILTDVIHDPGLKYNWEEHQYSAFVIEKDVIGIK